MCSPLTLSTVLSLMTVFSAARVLFQEVLLRCSCPGKSWNSVTRLAAVIRVVMMLFTVVCALDAVYKAAREQSGPAVPLQCAFEPAVFPLPMNKHNVALLKFQLSLALGRI